MTITVVGIGLIGGSMALSLKEGGLATKVIGVEANKAHRQKALDLGLVDELADLETAVKASGLVILSVPVNALLPVVKQVLDLVDEQVVMDVGSTKTGVLEAIKNHPARSRFVATHPMWGTEYSGPEAAVRGAFVGKATVICNKEESDEDAVALVQGSLQAIGYAPGVHERRGS